MTITGPRLRPSGRGVAMLRGAAAGALLLALAGCSLLGGGNRDLATIYAPDPKVTIAPSAPAVDWQLVLTPPQAARMVDSLRIAVRPTPGEVQVYREASWAKPPPAMIEDTLLRALEDSGRISGVARQGTGISPDYKLALELRRFESDYGGGPSPAATIEFNAKLIHVRDQLVVASRTFSHAEPAGGTAIPLVADAFSRGMEGLVGELGLWILTEGDAYQRRAHPAVVR